MRRILAALAATGLAVGLAGIASESAAMLPAEPVNPSRAPSAVLAPGTFGSMQVVCRSSHTNLDDPIVYPRQTGAAHQHDFFGNRSTDAFSTNASLAGKPTTCSRPGDTAAYWTPALLNNGRRVAPDRLIAYYRTRGIRDIASIRPVRAA